MKKKLLAFALALMLGLNFMPYYNKDGKINKTEVYAQNGKNTLTPEQVGKMLDGAIDELDKADKQLDSSLGQLQEKSKHGQESFNQLLESVPKYFAVALNEKDVQQSKNNAKAVLGGIVSSNSKSAIAEADKNLQELEKQKAVMTEKKKQLTALISGLSPQEQYALKDKIGKIKQLQSEVAGKMKALEKGLNDTKTFAQSMPQILNNKIDEVANQKLQSLKNKADESQEKKDERQRIIDKIKDCDTVEEVDDVNIPSYLKDDFDIISAKAERKLEILDDAESRSTVYDREERLDVRNIRIEKDEDHRGKYIVSGEVKDHIRKYVSVYYNDRFLGKGLTDGEGYFEITVNEEVYDNSNLKFYAGDQKYFTKDEVRITPWELKVSSYFIEGKYNINTNIKAYYKGDYIGKARTDKDGKFLIHSTELIENENDLTFYSVGNANDSSNISVNTLNPGDTQISGHSAAYADIIVRDSDDVRLGDAKADVNGNFTVFLNRSLIANEVLTFNITEDNRDEIRMDFTVQQISGGNLHRIRYASGYENSYFKGGANISRAESVMMISRLINNGSNFNTSKTTKFEDAETGWYAQAINFAVNKNLMKGYPDGNFEPDSYITRAEFASMVSRYLNLKNIGNSNLTDIQNHWAKDAIETLYGRKIVQGYKDGTFKPDENITRAEAVTVLNAAFGRKSTLDSFNNLQNPEMLRTFKDVRKSDWYYAQVLDAANDHTSYMNGDYEMWTSVK